MIAGSTPVGGTIYLETMLDRFGSVGGPRNPINGEFVNLDGTVRVLKEKCQSCPYRPDSPFHPQLKRIHKFTQEHIGSFNFCHSTYPSDVPDAICRGSYDAFKSDFINIPAFIDQPKSAYIVSADNSADIDK